MVYYPMGDLVREYRIRQGLTQEQLCEGICTPATLSKIENGLQTPGRRLLEALLERLGARYVMQLALLGEKDLCRFLLEQEIDRLFDRKDDTALLTKINEYEKETDSGNVLERQYILWCRALYEEKRSKPVKQVQKWLIEALQCTVQKFSMQMQFENRLFTIMEIRIMYKICRCEYICKRTKTAKNQVRRIADYLEKKQLKDSCGGLYSNILLTLAEWDARQRLFEESIAECEKAICYNTQKGMIHDLYELTSLMSQDYEKLGQSEEAGKYQNYAGVLQEIQFVGFAGGEENGKELSLRL
ncbi:MAG: helix-turn-helix domain-containing protein [Eubacterium sp.]|nr:helix-turn-helix domain-containing protein [Eubacterium sp.]